MKNSYLVADLEPGLKSVVIVANGQARARAGRMLVESLHQAGMGEVSLRFLNNDPSSLEPELRFQAREGKDLAVVALNKLSDWGSIHPLLNLEAHRRVGRLNTMTVAAVAGAPAGMLQAFNMLHPEIHRRLNLARRAGQAPYPLAA